MSLKVQVDNAGQIKKAVFINFNSFSSLQFMSWTLIL